MAHQADTSAPAMPVSAFAPSVGALGSSSFTASLLQGLRSFADISYCTIVDITGSRAVVGGVASAESDGQAATLTEAYVNGYFLQDPFVRDAFAAPPRRFLRPFTRTWQHGEMPAPGYMRRFFSEPSIVDKISIIQRTEHATRFLNLYKTRSGGTFDADERAIIAGSAEFLAALLNAHLKIARPDKGNEAFERRTVIWFHTLSERERAVAEVLGRGATAKEAALTLDIAPTSVITYKKRALQKLELASARDLMAFVALLGSDRAQPLCRHP